MRLAQERVAHISEFGVATLAWSRQPGGLLWVIPIPHESSPSMGRTFGPEIPTDSISRSWGFLDKNYVAVECLTNSTRILHDISLHDLCTLVRSSETSAKSVGTVFV